MCHVMHIILQHVNLYKQLHQRSPYLFTVLHPWDVLYHFLHVLAHGRHYHASQCMKTPYKSPNSLRCFLCLGTLSRDFALQREPLMKRSLCQHVPWLKQNMMRQQVHNCIWTRCTASLVQNPKMKESCKPRSASTYFSFKNIYKITVLGVVSVQVHILRRVLGHLLINNQAREACRQGHWSPQNSTTHFHK